MAQLTDLKLEGRPLTLLVNSENTARVAAAERIAGQLRSTGLKLTLEKLAFEDYTLALQKGDFDLYLGEVVLTADFDLSALLLPGGALNYGGWSDNAVSPLLSQFRASHGPLRSIHAKSLYDFLAQEVPIAPICFKNGCVLTRWGRLSGLSPVRGNVFYHLEGWNIAQIHPVKIIFPSK
jgi:peptide/nickel transport system substrate-binding protein